MLKLLKYSKPYKKWLLLGIFLVLFEIIADLFLPIITSNIINIGILNNDKNYIISNIIFMFSLCLIGIIGGILSTYYSSKSTGYMASDIRKELFKKINNLSTNSLDKLKVNHIVTVVSTDIPLVSSVYMLITRILIRAPILLIGSIIMTYIISKKLSLILILLLPLMMIIIYFIMKKAMPYFEYTENAIDEVNDIVREDINGIKVIKSFNNEKKENQKFDKKNKYLKKVNLEAIKILNMAMPIVMVIINLSTVVVLWIGHFDLINNKIQIGDIVAFIEYLNIILSAIMSAAAILLMMSRSEVSAKRILKILNEKQYQIESGKIIETIRGNIEFKNVDFEYSNGSGDYVLKNINLKINSGEKIAIIGPTGSGKSTLVSLISRMYELSNGKILIDNQDIKEYNLKNLKKQISHCLQKNYLFEGTIKENLKLNSICTEDEIFEVAEICNIKNFIESKENKLDYKINQKGTNLSGGQKQRLQIARTLLKKSNIIIFDDSMSAIDLKTERKIIDNINSFYQDKTIIYISSRISSFKNFDKIILMNDGQIIDIGSHEQLMKNDLYKIMYETQVNNYE